jgi:hypothetical protein
MVINSVSTILNEIFITPVSVLGVVHVIHEGTHADVQVILSDYSRI